MSEVFFAIVEILHPPTQGLRVFRMTSHIESS